MFRIFITVFLFNKIYFVVIVVITFCKKFFRNWNKISRIYNFDNRRFCKWFLSRSISLLETGSSSLSISRQNYIVPEIFLKVPDSASVAFKASRSKFDNSPEGRHSKYIRNNLSRWTELADECWTRFIFKMFLQSGVLASLIDSYCKESNFEQYSRLNFDANPEIFLFVKFWIKI